MHMLRPVDSPGDDLPWTGLFTGMIIGNYTVLVKRMLVPSRNNTFREITRVLPAVYSLRSSWQVSDPSRVAIFRERNYSAESGTRHKNKFLLTLWKLKKLGIPFRTRRREKHLNLRNFVQNGSAIDKKAQDLCLNHFVEDKSTGNFVILFRTTELIHGRQKCSEFC